MIKYKLHSGKKSSYVSKVLTVLSTVLSGMRSVTVMLSTTVNMCTCMTDVCNS